MAELRMYKYPLFPVEVEPVFDDTKTVEMPPSTGIQHIGMQDGWVVLWALVDRDAAPVRRTFHIAGTGHVLPRNPCYLGTTFERRFVWHIFETFPESVRG